jgi:hypothetical protein
VCEEHANGRTIDFLKIDVEGYESKVIAGADFERFRPKVLVVEAIEPETQLPNFAGWDAALTEGDFEFVLFDGINRFYVDHGHKRLESILAVPANAIDGFVVHQHVEKAERELQALERRFVEAERELQALERRFAEAETRTGNLVDEIRMARAEAKARARALERTRQALKLARIEVEDASLERDAAWAVLTSDHAEPNRES